MCGHLTRQVSKLGREQLCGTAYVVNQVPRECLCGCDTLGFILSYSEREAIGGPSLHIAQRQRAHGCQCRALTGVLGVVEYRLNKSRSNAEWSEADRLRVWFCWTFSRNPRFRLAGHSGYLTKLAGTHFTEYY